MNQLNPLMVSSSDISFLCEATIALTARDQQNKPASQQRMTDKSAIRAIPAEFKQEPVRDPFPKITVCRKSILSRILSYLKQSFHKNFV